LSYNERDTIFFRAGVKMRDQGGVIIRQARRMIEEIGFDPKTGLHSDDGAFKSEKEDVSDESIMKEIDTFLEDEGHDSLPRDDVLKKLLDLHDKALMLHHPVAKSKRIKLLKQEIIKLRRKLSMDKAGTSPGFKPKTDSDGGTPTVKKKKPREVSPMATLSSVDVDTPTGRRLRAGKEVDSSPESPNQTCGATVKKPAKPKGTKRPRSVSSGLEDEPDTSQPTAKRPKADEKTPVKSQPGGSPAKSPAGVNRRNAVLFTRKKQAQVTTPSKGDEEETKSTKPSTPAGRASSKKVLSSTDQNLELIENEVRSPQPPPPPPESADEGTPTKATRKKPASTSKSPPKSPAKATGGKKAAGGSFQSYRRGGDMPPETTDDDDTVTDSAVGATSEDGEETDESDSDAEGGGRNALTANMTLEPLDLVWAKCRGYPWYPALIINPKMPRTGYLHNGVPIPVPPQDVLDMASTHTTPHFLILFFDAKRTWQWLQRDKLEPLGVHFDMDKAKLVQSKKASERKAVRKAYEDAVQHRCRVTGENASISEESSETEDQKD